MNGDGLTPRRPPPLHSSTINSHQRHLSTTQTNEVLEESDQAGSGGLLLRLQRRLKQLEYENKTINEELDKGVANASKLSTAKKNGSWHLDELEVDRLKSDLKELREQILKGDEQATKEHLLGKISFVSLSIESTSASSPSRTIRCVERRIRASTTRTTGNEIQIAGTCHAA